MGATSASSATCLTGTAPSCCQCRATSGRSTRRRPAGPSPSCITATFSVTRPTGERSAVALGGEASVATNGFWASLTIATTLRLPMLFYIEDNGLGISVKGEMQTPGRQHCAQPGVVRQPAHSRRQRVRSRRVGALVRRCRGSRSRRQRTRAHPPDGAASVLALGAGQPEGLPHRGRDRVRRDPRSPSPPSRASRPGHHDGVGSGRSSRPRWSATSPARSTGPARGRRRTRRRSTGSCTRSQSRPDDTPAFGGLADDDLAALPSTDGA